MIKSPDHGFWCHQQHLEPVINFAVQQCHGQLGLMLHLRRPGKKTQPRDCHHCLLMDPRAQTKLTVEESWRLRGLQKGVAWGGQEQGSRYLVISGCSDISTEVELA